MNAVREKCRMMWRRMRKRCRNEKSYENVRLCMTENEFVIWAETRVRNFLHFDPKKTPSIDRIDPDGDYEFENMRIISVEENRTRSRFIFRFLGMEKLNHKDRIKILAESVIATCRNAGIDRKEMVCYLRDEI